MENYRNISIEDVYEINRFIENNKDFGYYYIEDESQLPPTEVGGLV